MSKRNRTAGHKWELKCVDKLKHLYPYIVSTRSESRSRDAQKIDLINKDELKNGSLPIQVQCKTMAKGVNYTRLMSEMPEGENVVLHQYTRKSQNGRFITKGEYAIIDIDFFTELLTAWELKRLQTSTGR